MHVCYWTLSLAYVVHVLEKLINKFVASIDDKLRYRSSNPMCKLTYLHVGRSRNNNPNKLVEFQGFHHLHSMVQHDIDQCHIVVHVCREEDAKTQYNDIVSN